MRAYALVAAAIGWFGLVLQYALVAQLDMPPSLVTRTINYFSYFTILSNIFAATTLTFAAFPSGSRLADFFTRPSVRGGVAIYMTVTGLVYFFLLRHLRPPEGWAFIADATLHDLMPLVYAAFWLLFATSGTLRVKNALVWLAFPLVYMTYSLLRGPVSGFYPYPFIDVLKLGYPQVFTNIGMLVVGFVLLALILAGLDRAIGRARAG